MNKEIILKHLNNYLKLIKDVEDNKIEMRSCNCENKDTSNSIMNVIKDVKLGKYDYIFENN